MKAYINYPTAHLSIHPVDDCRLTIRPRKKRRVVRVTTENLPNVIADFANRKYIFASNREYNDLWLEISLHTPKHEESFIYIVHSILSGHYKRFATAVIENHICQQP